MRVRTSGGVSNLRLLCISDVSVLQTSEPNGRLVAGRLDLTQAQEIDPPVLISGGRLNNDLDVFRFTASAGVRRVFVTQTHQLGLTPDPIFWLRDSQGKSLAYRHDTPGLGRDERLDYTFQQAGEYFLEVRSTGGAGWNNFYLLKAGDFNYARSVFPLGGRRGEVQVFEVIDRDGERTTQRIKVPDDPWSDCWQLPLEGLPGSLAWSMAVSDLPELREEEVRETNSEQIVAWPCVVNGRLDEPGEADEFSIAVERGRPVRILVQAHYLGSPLDGHLIVYDPAAKKLLAQSNDQRYRGGPDPALEFEPADTCIVTLSLRDTLRRGGVEYAYRLVIDRGGPDFYLRLGAKQTTSDEGGWTKTDAADTLNVRRGGEAELLVSVRRGPKDADSPYDGWPLCGFDGPIRIFAEGLPPGITAAPAVIEPGESEVHVQFRASADAPREPFEIAIVGEAARDDGTVIRRVAERKLFLADPQMVNLTYDWRVRKVTCVIVPGENEATRP